MTRDDLASPRSLFSHDYSFSRRRQNPRAAVSNWSIHQKHSIITCPRIPKANTSPPPHYGNSGRKYLTLGQGPTNLSHRGRKRTTGSFSARDTDIGKAVDLFENVFVIAGTVRCPDRGHSDGPVWFDLRPRRQVVDDSANCAAVIWTWREMTAANDNYAGP